MLVIPSWLSIHQSMAICLVGHISPRHSCLPRFYLSTYVLSTTCTCWHSSLVANCKAKDCGEPLLLQNGSGCLWCTHPPNQISNYIFASEHIHLQIHATKACNIDDPIPAIKIKYKGQYIECQKECVGHVWVTCTKFDVWELALKFMPSRLPLFFSPIYFQCTYNLHLNIKIREWSNSRASSHLGWHFKLLEWEAIFASKEEWDF